LQNTNTGSFTPGDDGYDVYRTAFDSGAVNCARRDAGNNEAIIKTQKRTGFLNFYY
jgi:hypothetical protein